MMLSIVACSSQSAQNQGNTVVNDAAVNDALPANAPTNAPASAGAPGTPGGLADDRTPLSEPKGPIDYKSAEAAGQVVQQYGGLLEQRKFAEARSLWSNDGKASGLSETQFAAGYDKYATIHAEVGRPAGMEGAAGSSYITVPFRLYGTLKSGGSFNLVGPLTLRRINDVPGSTDAQRHWHIEQSGLKARP